MNIVLLKSPDLFFVNNNYKFFISVSDLLEYAKNTYISLRSIDTRGRVCMKKNQLFVEPDYYSRHYIINMVAEGEEANNENRYLY